MCARYLKTSWKKDSFIILWILELGVCRIRRSLRVVVCIVHLIQTTIIMGGSTIHPTWDRSGWRMADISSDQLVASMGIYCYNK